MRSLASVVFLTLLAPAARADRAPSPAPAAHGPTAAPAAPSRPPSAAPQPGPPQPAPPQLVPIDPATVPEACKPLASQAQATSAASARISLASCMAERAVAPLALYDCCDSIAAIDRAIEPALALLDDVIEHADPASQVIAQHARGQLHAGFAVRLQATLPKVGPGASEAEVTLHDLRAQALEAQLAPWRDLARDAFQQVVELAKAHPELASNPVVTTAVRDSEQRLAADVALR